MSEVGERMTAEREAFEKWARNKKLPTMPNGDVYVYVESQIAWEAYQAGRAMAQAERERWIPVSEKLPELAGEYLVYQPGWDEGESADWMGQSAWWSVRTYGIDSEQRELTNVTHWKPLPKPPEAESILGSETAAK